jgi:Domain of unknown function (DUF4350)
MTTTIQAKPAAAKPTGAGARPALGRAWRGSWIPLTLLVVVVLGVVLAVLLFAAPSKSNDYLDPASATLRGSKALAQILTQHGYHVDEVYSPAQALADLGGSGPVTLLITSPDLLTAAQRRQLASADADLVLVGPGAPSLRVLAPTARVVNSDVPIVDGAEPSCSLAAANLAGPADAGGISYDVAGPAAGCYPVRGHPSVVRYTSGGRTITLVGTGLPLTNDHLGDGGNAALALNLLGERQRIVWLTPQPAIPTGLPRAVPNQRAPALIPAIAWLVVLQLAVALGLAVIWRARRFGPLIAERLPVVVRASETVEGHARLYQARRTRDRAAAALRQAMLARLMPLLGLAADAPPQTVVAELASRSARPASEIETISYGPPPATDLELVRLADDLDELEREVRSR